MNRIKLSLLKILSGLRSIISGKHAVGIIYNTKNGLIAAPIKDMAVGRHLGFNGSWNLKELEKLDKYISNSDCVYIVGTHVGTLLIPLAKKVVEVIGYEANPNTFKFLKWNLMLNNLTNVNLFNFAVGDSNKKVQFYANTINSGGSKIKPIIDKFLYNYDNPEIIEVEMISLDNHIIKENLTYPDVIIMDIEGAEYFALKGAQETLSKARLLYVEYVPHHLKNVANVNNQDFVNLIVPHFNTVQSIAEIIIFDLNKNPTMLLTYLDELMVKGKSDDLLFSKK